MLISCSACARRDQGVSIPLISDLIILKAHVAILDVAVPIMPSFGTAQ